MKQATPPKTGMTAAELREELLRAGKRVLQGIGSMQRDIEADQRRIKKEIKRGSRLSNGRIPY